MPLATYPVFLAFLCMGFGDVVGPLTGLLKEEYSLTNFMAQWIPFMGFIMFGALSIPIGIIQDRTGKQNILLTGLGLAFLGLSLPVLVSFSSFGLLLVSILMLGAGAALMQVSGNPFMRDVSAKGKYSRNLSLAQFVKAIGSLSGSLIPLVAIHYWNRDWKLLFPIYGIVTLATFILLASSRAQEYQPKKNEAATFSTSLRLLRNPFVLAMTIGIFLYVGAEVSMSSGLPIYLQDQFGLDLARMGLIGTLFFFLALTAGRFFGAILLNWIKPARFLVLSVAASVIGLAGLFANNQPIALGCIVLAGLGFANIFPLIFSITVDRLPERSNEISGLMVTAILGGAIIPPVMGAIADLTDPLTGFLVPGAAIIYIGIISIWSLRSHKINL